MSNTGSDGTERRGEKIGRDLAENGRSLAGWVREECRQDAF